MIYLKKKCEKNKIICWRGDSKCVKYGKKNVNDRICEK
jgi:hypothetical protein